MGSAGLRFRTARCFLAEFGPGSTPQRQQGDETEGEMKSVGPGLDAAVQARRRDRRGNEKTAGICPPFSLPLLGSNQDSPDPESGVLPVTPRGSNLDHFNCHGAEGDRTPDLCIANAALSQLSYRPQRVRSATPAGGVN